MREKELRLALVCYGGISLAIYMHGITKEIWHLARASRDYHEGAIPPPQAEGSWGNSRAVYCALIAEIEAATGTRLRIIPDIIAGASAGGINGIFLAQAIETGQSLDPLTDLWMDYADIDRLLDPDARPAARFTKFWASPLVWMAARRPGDTVERTVAPETREEVRMKLSRFIRSRWFEPPFGGAVFSNMLIDAFEAMERAPCGDPLLPPGHPLDLFVTVTDFDGYPQSLTLHSPAHVIETEHRLSIGFSAWGQDRSLRRFADPAELAFAARATASFPGAFPPFTVRELDGVLAERKRPWTGRNAFLARVLPRHWALGKAEDAVLIDGSVLANAPFAQAIGALRNRPSRREVDRRFVYIDPKPQSRSIRLTRSGEPKPLEVGEVPPLPGFFRTIFGALSDIPREQPIRDNLDAIAGRSHRIERMRQIIAALRPQIEQDVESSFGGTLFLDRPTPGRLASWRAKAQARAASAAGFAYPAYGHLKLSGIIDEITDLFVRLAADDGAVQRNAVQRALVAHTRHAGLDQMNGAGRETVNADVIQFFRDHDLGFRIRRLRFLARRLAEMLESACAASPQALTAMHDAIYGGLALYTVRENAEYYPDDFISVIDEARADPATALARLAAARDLRACDDIAEALLSDALWGLPKAERRQMLLAYLGFPFYDIATLPLLQGEGLDEYDPVKVDRISPEDCSAIRPADAAATLRGMEFNNFGAFFSRAYRENDYLWGRLHGAERLIDILLSTLPADAALPAERIDYYRKALFHAILDEESERLTLITDLIASLRKEIG
ncbi:patatin-like protein [Sphingobium algorifonticola]|uniref:Patatin-like protein n=1 Tax=Sphingobium algorifonticola TaxID=2008318 RepID=A0A437J550_9SPHN|nr:patatin-like protein [Sphingobium algorifonticola]RVT39867.1 patatin-like protein [Sphingobium algorifonticola]